MSEKVSIAELPGLTQYTYSDLLDQSAPPLLWELKVPPSIDAERIQVNMTRLASYHRIGAFSTSVVTEYQGERTVFTPGVSGINMDGSAIATKAGVTQKADRSTNDLIQDPNVPSFLWNEFGKAAALHNINKAELAQKSANKKLSSHGDLTREKAWAIELDGALRESFRNVTKSHLVNQTGKIQRYVDYTAFSVWAGSYGIGLLESGGENALISPFIFLGTQTLFTSLAALRARHETGSTLLDKKRWSIFYSSHQSDRYIALNGLSRLPGLITYRK